MLKDPNYDSINSSLKVLPIVCCGLILGIRDQGLGIGDEDFGQG
ncbi:MAG: hypothetical protein RBG1_1C00001G0794 [candidate division Zixibacteria bacterium RBG-1]|nr:MAG: hypothetical protein RBG1_1C00001G0794 [candidate division Zixibacteria bacterium RBG-1]